MSKIPRASWIALPAILGAAALLRWRLLGVPLERDEGEYAYAGQLILRGVLPYDQIYNMKLPGVYAAYAAILGLFGETEWAIHLGLLVVNAATIALIYVLGRQLSDEVGGLAAAAVFAVLSLGQSVQGIFANSEHFVLLPAIAGLSCTLRGIDRQSWRWLALGGFLVGLGFVMKQHGIAFVGLAGTAVAIAALRRRPFSAADATRSCGAFALAATVPYLLTCVLFWSAGLFDSFWFWTVDYALAYVSQVPLDQAAGALERALGRVIAGAPEAWILAAVGLSAVAWDARLRRRAVFVGCLCVFSFLAVLPGFLFRAHYFVLVLPAVAVLAGMGVSALGFVLSQRVRPRWSSALAGALLLGMLLPPLFRDRSMLFEDSPYEVSRSVYGYNPFPESRRLAEIISEISAPDDRVAVLGSEPQLFFYSNRRSASGYIYTYALMEDHDFALTLQEKMIREIEAAAPQVLVFVNIGTSWLKTERSHDLLFRWFENYRRGFELHAVAELWEDRTRYFFGKDAHRVNPRQRLSVEIYERRSQDGRDG